MIFSPIYYLRILVSNTESLTDFKQRMKRDLIGVGIKHKAKYTVEKIGRERYLINETIAPEDLFIIKDLTALLTPMDIAAIQHSFEGKADAQHLESPKKAWTLPLAMKALKEDEGIIEAIMGIMADYQSFYNITEKSELKSLKSLYKKLQTKNFTFSKAEASDLLSLMNYGKFYSTIPESPFPFEQTDAEKTQVKKKSSKKTKVQEGKPKPSKKSTKKAVKKMDIDPFIVQFITKKNNKIDWKATSQKIGANYRTIEQQLQECAKFQTISPKTQKTITLSDPKQLSKKNIVIANGLIETMFLTKQLPKIETIPANICIALYLLCLDNGFSIVNRMKKENIYDHAWWMGLSKCALDFGCICEAGKCLCPIDTKLDFDAMGKEVGHERGP
jgi:hypothetical protein